jgi:DNA-directed RNA polymerase specialized sigma24 family protein
MTIQMNRAPPINAASDNTRPPREVFDRLLADLRPKLHRYCARMTGSVIDGEDVVGCAVKALEAYDRAGPTANAEVAARIAHNAALIFCAAARASPPFTRMRIRTWSPIPSTASTIARSSPQVFETSCSCQ